MSSNSITSKIFGKEAKRPSAPSPTPSISKETAKRPGLPTPVPSHSLGDDLHMAASHIATAVGFGGKPTAHKRPEMPPTPSTPSHPSPSRGRDSTGSRDSYFGEEPITLSSDDICKLPVTNPEVLDTHLHAAGFSAESTKQLEVLASSHYSEFSASLSSWSSTTIEEATRRVSMHTTGCHEIAELQRQVIAKMEAHCSAGKVEIETLVRYENILRNVAVLVKKYEQEIIVLREQVKKGQGDIEKHNEARAQAKIEFELEIERTRTEERKRMVTRFSKWVMSMWGMRIEAMTAEFHSMVKKYAVMEEFQKVNWEAVETVTETETITETEKIKASATATITQTINGSTNGATNGAAHLLNGTAHALTNGVPRPKSSK
ncbi:hypothetical protein EXIGLDRAFT_707879 [Exidia glandulosa HHB12029]|uniref:Uncharacterized protein n=1 Tax=Exidia glandulosa HHB12029 TaxID=1314781 RepID=A0A166NDE1_EXIGL|nr:hypothetical protein EXIGLDRAFT_707879 [Exidia glandulosa HHB12029]